MNYTPNLNDTFTLDMANVKKSDYPYNAQVWINGEKVREGVTATILPYITSLPIGVNSIEIKLFSVNGSYSELICKLNDTKLYCAVLDRLSKLDKDKRLKDYSLILYYLLSKGLDDSNCICACPNLKLLYKDLNDILNPDVCC